MKNTSRCVHGQGYEKIVAAFAEASEILHSSKNPSLRNLGIEIKRDRA